MCPEAINADTVKRIKKKRKPRLNLVSWRV
jgi:hypothetical protein